jgi:hypothetical protein
MNDRSEVETNRQADSASDDLSCIIQKALHADPAQRYASVRGLSDDLASFNATACFQPASRCSAWS